MVNELDKKIHEQMKRESSKPQTRRQRILESLKGNITSPERIIPEPDVPLLRELIEERTTQGRFSPTPYDISSIKQEYKETEEISKRFMATQKKFNSLLKIKNSLFLRILYKTKEKLVRYLFESEEHTIEELFETQLSNMGELERKISKISRESKKVLNTFKDASDSEVITARADYEKVKKLSREIPQIKQQISQEQEIFGSLPYDSDKYLGQKLKLRDLKRKYRDLETELKIANDGLSFRGKEQEVHFNKVELLLNFFVSTGEVISKQVHAVVYTLQHTHAVIQTSDYIWKVLGKNDKSLETLKNNTTKIYETLSNGATEMKKIASSKPYGSKMLEEGNREIGRALDYSDPGKKLLEELDRLEEI